MDKSQYKAFAYADTDKPTVFFGASEEEILSKIASYNRARTEKTKFRTCNIGRLNIEKDTYEDYHKYDAVTGKDITPAYLILPEHLTRTEFNKVITELKKAGAKYHPYKKQWYTTQEQWLECNRICWQFERQPKDLKEIFNEPQSDEQKREAPEFHLNELDIIYNVKMDNYPKTISISFRELGEGRFFDDLDNLINRLNEIALKKIQIIAEEKEVEQAADRQDELPEREMFSAPGGYSVSISRDNNDNRCTVWFHDGRDPIEIKGDSYNLYFPTMAPEEVSVFVEEYMRRPDESADPPYAPGDRMDCYIPMRTSIESVPYIENILHLEGNVISVDEGVYQFQEEDGKIRAVDRNEIYTSGQAQVLLRALEDELTTEQFDLLADRRLTAAQMEEIRFGFKDGLSAEQTALYANPDMKPAQMDLCRIGLLHGLSYAEISSLLRDTKELSWIDSRNRLNNVIRENKQTIMRNAEPRRHHQNSPKAASPKL